MVLIPLLILFLTCLQIITAVHSRNIEKVNVQDVANKRAITSEFEPTDRYVEIESSGDLEINLLVTHSEENVIPLLPGLNSLFGGDPIISVDGVAVIEAQR